MIDTYISKWGTDLYSFITGAITVVLGYFYPMRNIVHLLLFLFLFDVICGYWAARKLRHERFNVKLVWGHTCPRILLTLGIIILLYLWDDVHQQTIIRTYNYFAMFISGVLIYSIMENAYAITKWNALNIAKIMIWKKFKGEENMDIDIREEINKPQ